MELEMLKIGFTGTRHGMTKNQEKELEKLVKAKEIQEFHHGMCIGSDEQAHFIVSSHKPKIKIVGHPPQAISTKAQLCCHKELPPDSWSRRNKDIVDSGLSVGIIGYAVGNFLGVFIAEFLRIL